MQIFFNVISKKVNWTQNQSLNFDNTCWPNYPTQDENYIQVPKHIILPSIIPVTMQTLLHNLLSHYKALCSGWLLYLHSKFTKKEFEKKKQKNWNKYEDIKVKCWKLILRKEWKETLMYNAILTMPKFHMPCDQCLL
jgi:hypothetical protein